MVTKYPSNIDDLKGRREHVPLSEIKFFEIIDSLNDDWHVWHSVRWDKDTKMRSGEADYLLFNHNYGFIVIEVKGGIISIENGNFFTTNTRTGEIYPLNKDPFDQAERSMHHIRNFYIDRAKVEPNSSKLLKKNKFFPLNFAYAVFFPDCEFKQDFQYLQYSFNKIFDETDLTLQIQWQNEIKTGIPPLEKFLIDLLNQYKSLRKVIPEVAEFFPKLIGSNISRYINLSKYYDIREQELIEVNEVQDFLINALSEKKRCVFRGSAGSGKTFIAMKRALENYNEKKTTLFLCFNSELRESIRTHLSEQVGVPYDKLKGNIDVFSINMFLSKLIKSMFDSDTERRLLENLYKFSYEPIAVEIKARQYRVPISLIYDTLLIDEAQDIDPCLWDMFIYLLKNTEESLFYVFYDEEQSLFAEDFSLEHFGMDEKRDLIVLRRNLRNTVEIAKWLNLKTTYGSYEKLSGINGFKISAQKFSNSKEALMKTMNIIKNKYYKHAINQNKIIILSYYKLKTIIPNVNNDTYCDFISLVGKSSQDRMYLIEPNSLANMEHIKSNRNFENYTVFKTISSFKGLERDIIFLIVPNMEEFKKRNPDKYDNFLMQIYVGASRAKFKLYFLEYNM